MKKLLLILLSYAGILFGQIVPLPNDILTKNVPSAVNNNVNWLNANKMQFRGTWNTNVTYTQSNVVLYNNALYVTQQISNTGNIPSSNPFYWFLIGSTSSTSNGITISTNPPSSGCAPGSLYLQNDPTNYIQQFNVCGLANTYVPASYLYGNSLPANCIAGQLYLDTNNGSISWCSSPGIPGLWSNTPSFYPGNGTSKNLSSGFAPVFAVTSPPSTGWTIDNIGYSTLTSSSGYEYFDSVINNVGTPNLIAAFRMAPTPPYTLTVLLLTDILGTNLTAGSGICFRDSTGKLITFRTNENVGSNSTIHFDKWNSSISFNSDYNSGAWHSGVSTPQWLRLKDDGINISAWKSLDGINFYQYGISEPRTDFMTSGPTEIGVLLTNDSARVVLDILSWVIN